MNPTRFGRAAKPQHVTETTRSTTPASAALPARSAQQSHVAAAMTNGFWAAKKRLPNGREIRYWQGEKNGRNTRAAGWYGQDFAGGWADASTPFLSDAPLNENEAGVELMSRTAEPFAPVNKLAFVEETWDFTATMAGRERSRGSIRSMPRELQVERFGELVTYCQNVDNLIELFNANEKDVTKWRNALAALSGAQIALGIVGGGLIIAGIVATGGLAAIPMAAGAIAISATSAVAGVAVGAARSVAEVGLENAQREGGVQHGRAVVGGTELAKGIGGVGAKEGLTRGLVAATHAGAASVVGAGAGGGGVAISLVKGGMGAHKAYKVNVGAIWSQVDWTQAIQNLTEAETFLKRHSKGFDAGMLIMIKAKLEATKANVAEVMQQRWRDESQRVFKR